jgi:GntR family transcriptional regulator/MocR family aminotransferase
MVLPGLKIDSESSVPVYRQIAEGIRLQALEGLLHPGDRLPPTRDLARQLGVNRNTVVAAYDLLSSDGTVHSTTGRGTFLAGGPQEPQTDGERSSAGEGAWFTTFSRAVAGPGIERLLSMYQVALSREGISFAGSYPAGDLIPVEPFRNAMASVLREDAAGSLAYGPTAGLPGLREWLAKRMRKTGSDVSAENILVTNGAQQALEITFRAFLDPEDPVVLEDPTYTGVLSIVSSLGARAIGVPTDNAGIRPDYLEAAMDRHRPRLLYLQPTFHNPTARVMTATRRREVLDLAVRYNCPVVEDDWAGGLRFEGVELPTLHALDGGRHVLYLSTFSKKLMPGLRIGWVAAPVEVVQRLIALKQITDCGTSPVLQAALLRFLENGDLENHLDRIRSAYRKRRDIMLESLARHFPAEVAWEVPEGGLFLWIMLPDGLDSGELFVAARREGVLFSRGEVFHVDGSGSNTMRLTYAAVPPGRIDEGIAILGNLIRKRWADSDRPAREAIEETLPIL